MCFECWDIYIYVFFFLDLNALSWDQDETIKIHGKWSNLTFNLNSEKSFSEPKIKICFFLVCLFLRTFTKHIKYKMGSHDLDAFYLWKINGENVELILLIHNIYFFSVIILNFEGI